MVLQAWQGCRAFSGGSSRFSVLPVMGGKGGKPSLQGIRPQRLLEARILQVENRNAKPQEKR